MTSVGYTRVPRCVASRVHSPWPPRCPSICFYRAADSGLTYGSWGHARQPGLATSPYQATTTATAKRTSRSTAGPRGMVHPPLIGRRSHPRELGSARAGRRPRAGRLRRRRSHRCGSVSRVHGRVVHSSLGGRSNVRRFVKIGRHDSYSGLRLTAQPLIAADLHLPMRRRYGFGFGFGFDSSKRMIAGGEISATIACGIPAFSSSLIARYGRPAKILRA
jgi:hypothetical protein